MTAGVPPVAPTNGGAPDPRTGHPRHAANKKQKKSQRRVGQVVQHAQLVASAKRPRIQRRQPAAAAAADEAAVANTQRQADAASRWPCRNAAACAATTSTRAQDTKATEGCQTAAGRFPGLGNEAGAWRGGRAVHPSQKRSEKEGAWPRPRPPEPHGTTSDHVHSFMADVPFTRVTVAVQARAARGDPA